MILDIEPASPVPVYEQVRAQIAEKIASEQLPAGTKLPTIRALAAQLGLAVNTVAHAYRELESAGLIKTRPRLGTTVASSNSSRARLREAARDYAALANRLGVPHDDALREVSAYLAQDSQAAAKSLSAPVTDRD